MKSGTVTECYKAEEKLRKDIEDLLSPSVAARSPGEATLIIDVEVRTEVAARYGDGTRFEWVDLIIVFASADGTPLSLCKRFEGDRTQPPEHIYRMLNSGCTILYGSIPSAPALAYVETVFTKYRLNRRTIPIER
jgi:hypothetical protein